MRARADQSAPLALFAAIMAPTKLTDEERASLVAPLHKSGWTLVDGRDAMHKVVPLRPRPLPPHPRNSVRH